MLKMRSNVCPITKCNDQFQSLEALQRHMKDKHDMTFCSLCLVHRPLFLSEQPIFKVNQLKKHMKTGMVPFSNVKATAAHPVCQFCADHFYDANDLYKHMRNKHTTCHLCSAMHEHRYYRDAASLLTHTR